MFCRKCGTKLDSDAKFCITCGTPTEANPSPLVPEQTRSVTAPVVHHEPVVATKQEEPPTVPKPKKKKKGLLTFAILLVCVVGLAVATFVLNPGGIVDNIGIFGDPATDVITALEDGDYSEALLLVEELPENAIPSLQNMLSHRLDTLLTDFRNEDVEHSVVLMELYTIGRMGISELSSEIRRVEQSINNLNSSRIAFNSAEELHERGDYPASLAQFRLVIMEDPNYEEAQAGAIRVVTAYRTQMLGTADEYIRIGNYPSAIRTLSNALTVLRDDPELTQSLNVTTQSYITASISEARALLEQGNFDGASSEITVALLILPGNEQFIQMRDEIESARPVRLSTVVVVDSVRYSFSSDVHTDSFGNISDGSHFFDASLNSYAVYNLDENFTSFSGSIVANQNTGSEAAMTISIFGDDELLFARTEFNRRTGAIEFEVDVTGVTRLEIRTSNQGRFPNGHFSLVNAMLSR